MNFHLSGAPGILLLGVSCLHLDLNGYCGNFNQWLHVRHALLSEIIRPQYRLHATWAIEFSLTLIVDQRLTEQLVADLQGGVVAVLQPREIGDGLVVAASVFSELHL